jgi:hypothetical protein
MDPILSKAVTPSISDPSSGGLGAQLPKDGASQFDKIKAQLKDAADQVSSSGSQAAQAVSQTPAQPASVVPTQPPSAAVQPVDSSVKAAPGTAQPASLRSLPPGPEKVQKAMAVGRYHLDRVGAAIKSNPSSSTMDKVKGKLTSIEAQYNQLDVTLQKISPNASPQDWLRLQQMASSMNENVNVLSKLVDSASSGIKTIVQTQI